MMKINFLRLALRGVLFFSLVFFLSLNLYGQQEGAGPNKDQEQVEQKVSEETSGETQKESDEQGTPEVEEGSEEEGEAVAKTQSDQEKDEPGETAGEAKKESDKQDSSEAKEGSEEEGEVVEKTQPKEEEQKEEAPEETAGEPQKESEEDTSEAEEESEEESGPETVHLTEEQIGFRGNWVKKREWLLQAREKNSKIQTLSDEVQASRDPFWEKYKNIQAELDEFYSYAGQIQGKIETVYSLQKAEEEVKEKAIKQNAELAKKVAEEKKARPWYKNFWDKILMFTDWVYDKITCKSAPKEKKPIAPKKQITKVEAELDEEEEEEEVPDELELFKVELGKVKDLDDALVKRMEKLDQEIDVVDKEAAKARKLLSEIWDMIDDEKARKNFYELKTISKKIKSIKEYVSGAFGSDFDATVETLNKQKEKIKTKVKSLEEKGFFPQSTKVTDKNLAGRSS